MLLILCFLLLLRCYLSTCVFIYYLDVICLRMFFSYLCFCVTETLFSQVFCLPVSCTCVPVPPSHSYSWPPNFPSTVHMFRTYLYLRVTETLFCRVFPHLLDLLLVLSRQGRHGGTVSLGHLSHLVFHRLHCDAVVSLQRLLHFFNLTSIVTKQRHGYHKLKLIRNHACKRNEAEVVANFSQTIVTS